MITKKKCQQIISLAIDHAKGKADGIEVTVSGSDIATSRFAVNNMTQNQAPIRVGISVRILKDGRQARQDSDDISPKGVRAVVDNAIAAAKLLDKDQEMLPLMAPQARATSASKKPVSRYHAKTAKMTAQERAWEIRMIIDIAREHNLEAAGVYASGSFFSAIGNSLGLFEYHHESSAECSVTMVGYDSSGWAKANSTSRTAFSGRDLALKAADACIKSRNPVEIAPGKYTVILPPNAVLDLLCFLWGDFSGTRHSDQLGSLINKVGQKVFGENISIVDDITHPLQAGAPFDGEGLERTVLALVEKGIVKSLVHGRRSAIKHGAVPTGHGLMEPTSRGEYPLNLVVKGGDTSTDEMIKTTDKGILLSRVWYVRTVDPRSVLLTGMTRDGTFLIEDGKVKCGVKNLRFNVSVIDLLNSVLALGPSVRAAGEEGFPAVVPAMKVANFNFTSTTKF